MKASGKLPGQLTSFVGREPAVLMVCQRLQSDRFVTLVGSGGCGKTRLSLEVGRRVAEVRPDGVFFVDLSGLTEPGLVPNAVLQALGLRAAPGRDPVDVLVARLSKRELLLILDNCEHLLDVCASVASALASGCPGLWTLATSRQSLGVTGEIVVLVEGLELPDRGQVGGADWVTRSEAGKLFIDRAARASPGFLVEDASAAFVAQICERLEGIPLAIELAAARTRLMSLRAIAEGLSDRFRLLVATGRAGPSRHRSLLASIEWSCSLLRKDERALLWRLSVFASGFTLAAAEAVCSGNDSEPERVLGLLSSIVDKCLVQADPAADRFRLHDSMRAYAATALATEKLGPAVRGRHFSYFLHFATAMRQKIDTSEIAAALVAMEPDLDNFRAAVDWSIESGQFDAGAELLGALGRYYFVLGLWPEAVARCQALLTTELLPARRAPLLGLAAHCSRNSDPAASLRLATELTTLGRSLGDDKVLADGLQILENTQAWSQPEAALRTSQETLQIAQRAGLPWPAIAALLDKSWAYFWLGRLDEARSLVAEALRQSRDRDDLWSEVIGMVSSSVLETYCGRPAMALEEAGTLVRRCTELGSPTFACWGERHRAEAYIHLGDNRARDALARARALAESVDDAFNLACTDTTEGLLQVSVGGDDQGYPLIEAGTSKLESFGFARMCVRDRAVLSEVALRRGDLGTARSHLEAAAWRLPRIADPEGVPILRAEARYARAQGSSRRATG